MSVHSDSSSQDENQYPELNTSQIELMEGYKTNYLLFKNKAQTSEKDLIKERKKNAQLILTIQDLKNNLTEQQEKNDQLNFTIQQLRQNLSKKEEEFQEFSLNYTKEDQTLIDDALKGENISLKNKVKQLQRLLEQANGKQKIIQQPILNQLKIEEAIQNCKMQMMDSLNHNFKSFLNGSEIDEEFQNFFQQLKNAWQTKINEGKDIVAEQLQQQQARFVEGIQYVISNLGNLQQPDVDLNNEMSEMDTLCQSIQQLLVKRRQEVDQAKREIEMLNEKLNQISKLEKQYKQKQRENEEEISSLEELVAQFKLTEKFLKSKLEIAEQQLNNRATMLPEVQITIKNVVEFLQTYFDHLQTLRNKMQAKNIIVCLVNEIVKL